MPHPPEYRRALGLLKLSQRRVESALKTYRDEQREYTRASLAVACAIRRMLGEGHIKQVTLAKRLGEHQAVVSQRLSGTLTLTPEEATRYADAILQ